MSKLDESINSTPIIVDVGDWLKYYSECRQYLLAMGQKFTGLLGQASVFSFGALTAILTLKERLGIQYPSNLWVALPAAFGLAMYLLIILKYFLQIRATGDIMGKIEKLRLGLTEELGLVLKLRGWTTAFYGSNWALAAVFGYGITLLSLPLIAATCLSG